MEGSVSNESRAWLISRPFSLRILPFKDESGMPRGVSRRIKGPVHAQAASLGTRGHGYSYITSRCHNALPTRRPSRDSRTRSTRQCGREYERHTHKLAVLVRLTLPARLINDIFKRSDEWAKLKWRNRALCGASLSKGASSTPDRLASSISLGHARKWSSCISLEIFSRWWPGALWPGVIIITGGKKR